LARFAKRTPDVELIVRLGTKQEKEPLVEVVSPLRKTDQLRWFRKPDEEVTLVTGNAQIEVRNAADPASFPLFTGNRGYYQSQFKAADKDNNGYLDMQEAQQSPVFRDLFKLMDRNGDGKLFEKEMLDYLDEVDKFQKLAAGGCAALALSEQSRGLFDLLDTDGDGRLSVREMRNAVRLIEQLDHDGDGQISRREIPRNYQITLNRGPANPSSFANMVGTPFGFVTDMSGPPPPRPQRGPLWFRKMDRNRDGDVSRREFLGTDEEFRRIDTDGDGLLSVEEAERADQWFRQHRKKGK
jgi:Ca2+-binding EF-hand superfamily protein